MRIHRVVSLLFAAALLAPAAAQAQQPPTCDKACLSGFMDQYFAALQAHDARFDGRLYVGVTSTGIYCRPVCRVRLPRRENCRFFSTAAQAEAERFRPCMKCRPELAPRALPWTTMDASRTLAQQAAAWLDSCDDAEASVEKPVNTSSSWEKKDEAVDGSPNRPWAWSQIDEAAPAADASEVAFRLAICRKRSAVRRTCCTVTPVPWPPL